MSPPFLPHSAEITATSSKTDVKLCQNSNLKMRKKKSPEELIFKLTNEKKMWLKKHTRKTERKENSRDLTGANITIHI